MKHHIKALTALVKTGNVSEVAVASVYRAYIRDLIPKFWTEQNVLNLIDLEIEEASTKPLLTHYYALKRVKAIITSE